MTGPRVALIGFPDRQGEIWTPKYANEYESFWHAAKALGLTADPEPDQTRVWYLVQWDDRPGALMVHYSEEVTLVPPPPEPTDRDRLIAEIETAMWQALWSEENDKAMGAYVSQENGMIDATGAGISLRPAAEAALKVFGEDLLKAFTRILNGVDDE